jgi:hypothetical protein
MSRLTRRFCSRPPCFKDKKKLNLCNINELTERSLQKIPAKLPQRLGLEFYMLPRRLAGYTARPGEASSVRNHPGRTALTSLPGQRIRRRNSIKLHVNFPDERKNRR